MAYLNWDDSFSVQVKEIDAQHQTLIEMINSLHDAMATHRGREKQSIIIDAIVNYADLHFRTEEIYMRRFGYPDYSPHKIEHDQFTIKALDLKDRAKNQGFILTLEILNFLKDWLKNHILVTDMGYVQHFSERGLH